MNYRHGYHAGNFADVLKHAVLACVAARLGRVAKPVLAIDTHAGAGLYDLQAPNALKTGEWREGIGRVLAAPHAPDILKPYIDIVKKANPDGDIRYYPGSPLILRDTLRPTDKIALYELRPEDAQALAALTKADKRIKARRADGWKAVGAEIRSADVRPLVLIDPPFESDADFDRSLDALSAARTRSDTACVMVWHPIKDEKPVAAFREKVKRGTTDALMTVELTVAPPAKGEKLTSSGLLILRPPRGLNEDLHAMLPWLKEKLAVADGAKAEWRWLIAPR